MLRPNEIKRLGYHGIEIEWHDGVVHALTSQVLRGNCPSASSLAKRGDSSHDKPLSGKSRLAIVSSSKSEELKLEHIWLIGNYALGMRWGDGHDTGIFSFKLLRELGDKHGALETTNAQANNDANTEQT
jgi:DUF971 family protein